MMKRRIKIAKITQKCREPSRKRNNKLEKMQQEEQSIPNLQQEYPKTHPSKTHSAR